MYVRLFALLHHGTANLSQPVRSVILAVICVALYIWFVALIVCLQVEQTPFSLILLYITRQFCSIFVHYFKLLYNATIYCIHDLGNDEYFTESRLQIFAFHFVCNNIFCIFCLSAKCNALLCSHLLTKDPCVVRTFRQETQLKLAVADRTKPEVEIWRRPKNELFDPGFLFTPSDTFWLGRTVLPQYKTLQTDRQTTDRRHTVR